MFDILKKKKLATNIYSIEIYAPLVAKKAQPGEFIILRTDEHGERIPLTINKVDLDRGLVTIIFQSVGTTTSKLSTLEVGDKLLDFLGPLGKPTELDGLQKVCIVLGGVGAAIGLPIAQKLHDRGSEITVLSSFRSKDRVILDDELKALSDNYQLFVDENLEQKENCVTYLGRTLKEGVTFDRVFAIGPLKMMEAIAEVTRPYKISTIVSMNPIMIDGTGMCGGCRIKVGDETKFACVDGPDFDAHLIDFKVAYSRLQYYNAVEKENYKKYCNLTGEIKNG